MTPDDDSPLPAFPDAMVVNVEITEYVQGHMSYRTAVPALLRKLCGFPTWSDNLEVIEEVVAGDWMDSIDGWWTTDADKKRKRKRKKTGDSLGADKSDAISIAPSTNSDKVPQ
jgi:hypothetical protein